MSAAFVAPWQHPVRGALVGSRCERLRFSVVKCTGAKLLRLIRKEPLCSAAWAGESEQRM